MAEKIERIAHRPKVAVDGARLAEETTGLIEGAAGAAGIPTAGLKQIVPQSSQRLGDTAYKEKPTLVLLRNVSLGQVTSLVHELIAWTSGLRAKSIRLTAPRPEDTGDRWNSDVVVTYLIYEPPQKPK